MIEEDALARSTVAYFAGATMMAFLRESTSLPLRVVNVQADPPDGFFLDLSSGVRLRVSVARVRTGLVPARAEEGMQ